MGTNYFLRFNACEHCARYEEAHIGKQSAGWSFLLRGYEHRLVNEQYPDWGYDPRSPFGFEVRSRADWRTVLLDIPGEVFDEYGRQVTESMADTVDWLEELQPPDDGRRAFEDQQENISRSWWAAEATRRDAEGFRIETREFS